MKRASLYDRDETAWLDETAELVRARKFDEVDFENLAQYLDDMARRDRKELQSRLRQLLIHWLKWDYQPEGRTRSWVNSILHQRGSVKFDCQSGSLRDHAEKVLQEAYAQAVTLAANQIGKKPSDFPKRCPYTLEQLTDREPQIPKDDE
jgi:hypothetical protein